MNYSAIKECDIADGDGVRVSLFVSGCTHHCVGCFNESTWNFDAGAPFTENVQNRLFSALAPQHIAGLTLLGGEPFEPENQIALLPFIREVRRKFPAKTIWAYTGCVYERDLLTDGSRWRNQATDEILSLIDVLVDGPFIETQKDISLKFRGSTNQRILKLMHGKTEGDAINDGTAFP